MLHQIFSKDRIGALQTSLNQLLNHRRQEFACIRQFSEEDCGAACIATICEHHGRQFSLGKVREAVGTMANGTTLLGLKRGAEQLGLIARAAKADATLLESIEELPLPVICHWDGNHWVVLHGRDQDHQPVSYIIFTLHSIFRLLRMLTLR